MATGLEHVRDRFADIFARIGEPATIRISSITIDPDTGDQTSGSSEVDIPATVILRRATEDYGFADVRAGDRVVKVAAAEVDGHVDWGGGPVVGDAVIIGGTTHRIVEIGHDPTRTGGVDAQVVMQVRS
jgi:hypothetical protein